MSVTLKGEFELGRAKMTSRLLMQVANVSLSSFSWFSLLTGMGSPQAADSRSNLYIEQIRPLFEEHCQMCHNADLKKGGLDLSTPKLS